MVLAAGFFAGALASDLAGAFAAAALGAAAGFDLASALGLACALGLASALGFGAALAFALAAGFSAAGLAAIFGATSASGAFGAALGLAATLAGLASWLKSSELFLENLIFQRKELFTQSLQLMIFLIYLIGKVQFVM